MREAMKRLSIALLLTWLLAACTSGDRQQRLAQLEELERQNVADSLMTNDSLAQALADFFDRHGTPNERLRAHYILGRTYADLGEAPAALNAYLDAATCADTTAQDCDWAKLSRVYGQMSDVFYKQNLMEDYISNVNQAVYYAWKANDTVQAINENALKIGGYVQLKQDSLVISSFNSAFDQLKDLYGEGVASRYCPLVLSSLLSEGKTEDAGTYLNLYRNKSGYFDSLGNIDQGREIYYYYVGLYYLSRQEYDSAATYFRKELNTGRDIENQCFGSRGLSIAFQHLHQPDSSAKYAIYAFAMNDSVYAAKAVSDVATAKAQYNYSRQQQIAHNEHLRAELHQKANRLLLELLVAVFVLVAIGFVVWWKKKSSDKERFNKKVEELNVLKSDLEAIKMHETELCKIIRNLEQTTAQKTSEIDGLRSYQVMMEQKIVEKQWQIERLSLELSQHKNSEELLQDVFGKNLSGSAQYKVLLQRARHDGKMSDNELVDIDKMVSELLPNFHFYLSSKRQILTSFQYNLCLLLRLHLDIKQSANLLGVSSSYVSKASKEVLQKLFGELGNGLLLKKRLEGLVE